jgi:DNA-directed RNA polymerase
MGIAEQIAEVARMQTLGIQKYRKNQLKAVSKGRGSHAGSGANVTASLVPVLAKALKESLDLRKKRGPRPQAMLELRKLRPEVSSLIAIRTVIDLMAQRRKLTSTAHQIGARVEDELRFKSFKKQAPKEYKMALAKVANSTDYRYKHKVLIGLMKACDGVEHKWEPWKPKLRIRVGSHLLDLLLSATNLLDVVEYQHSKLIVPSVELLASLARMDAYLEELHPYYLATTDLPQDWDGLEGGGYVAMCLPLVKNVSGAAHQHMASQPVPSPTILTGLNAIQRTPWRINREVLEVINTLWGIPYAYMPQVPSREADPPPTRPDLPFDLKAEDMDPVQLEMLTAYKRARAQNIEAEIRRSSQLLTSSQIRVAAQELCDKPAFYFPQQLDWRGRAYPVPIFLSPQGPDIARGLLEFANAKPFGDGTGVEWFLITGANHFGVDKLSFTNRVAWVDWNHDLLMAVAGDPLSNTWWMGASEPYQFLAWVFEYAEWVEGGRRFDFESHQVVGMDGSCNGLQHFSAMLRDPVGGSATNLVPAAQPQDIYQRVCDVVKSALEDLEREGDPTEQRLAHAWLVSGLLDRNVCKRQVMTLPYGATRQGMQDQLMSYLGGVRDETQKDLPFEDPWEASLFLTRLIYSSIGEVVVAASTVMTWLQTVAQLASKKGLPLRWRTPHGFVVRQAYRSRRKSQIETQICGRIQLSIREYTKAIDKRKQAAGISPNFVHALDACHMLTTAAELKDLDLAMVHDSFGTHAGDAARMARTLRATFVQLYQDHDVLAELKADLEADTGISLPDPPEKGELDIEEVRNALYFFA